MRGYFFVRGGVCAAALMLACNSTWAQPVLITAPQTVVPGQATITPTAGGAAVPLATAQITVSGTNITLNFDGQHTIASLLLQNNARISHTQGFTFTGDEGGVPTPAAGMWLTVTGDCTINSGSEVFATGRGFLGGSGPGAGTFVAGSACTVGASGGSHGGVGAPGRDGVGALVLAPTTYGDWNKPLMLGSGGGNTDGGAGGTGGGAVRLTVGGTLTVNGTIEADGLSATNASGAGGSILIDAGTLAGAGTIRANGGSAQCAVGRSGGGGGRVAVETDASTYTGSFLAHGTGGGGAGSVLLRLGASNPQLIFDNASNSGGVLAAATHFATPLVTPAGMDLIVRREAKLTHTPGDGAGLQMQIGGNLIIESGGRIDVSERGFGGGSGLAPGQNNLNGSACTHVAGGGGHGGSGAVGTFGSGVLGGGTYGSFASPTTMGSGGGNTLTETGAPGGGVARIIVSGAMLHEGTIRANGGQNTAASGAGGSVWISAGSLTGAGSISAAGGTAQCQIARSGGGGGRIAIEGDLSGYSGGVLANGLGGGGAGSVYLDDNSGDVRLIYENNFDPRLSEQSAPIVTPAGVDLIVRRGAWLSHQPGSSGGLSITVGGDMIIESDGRLDVSGRGHPSATGPGAGQSIGGSACSVTAGGGSYGGSGAASLAGARGGVTYGDFASPDALGSGGGATTDTPGGAGGGKIRLIVQGALTNEGQINANGEQTTASAGSGGSIWISSASTSGAGSIRARGGSAQCAINRSGGGGGRIAISGTLAGLAGSVLADGEGGGGVGSVYLAPTDQRATLIFDNAGDAMPSIQHEAIVTGSADIVVRNAAWLTHPSGDGAGLLIDAGNNLTIESGARIDASGAGFAAGMGPGAGLNVPGGSCGQVPSAGGHGGVGGVGTGPGGAIVQGGLTYGSSSQPIEMGSGGGSSLTSTGGRGGGVVRINVAENFTLNGAVRADGAQGQSAGSGGSVWITTNLLTGTGTIEADGGASECVINRGGGGGGRVAVYACFNTLPGSNATANGAAGGAPGTVVIASTQSELDPVVEPFCNGTDAVLTVEAGGVGVLGYQWRKDGIDLVDGPGPGGSTISGATTRTLTISQVAGPNSGDYSVFVTADCGSATSTAVPIAVGGASSPICDSIDFNRDCLYPDDQDLIDFLSVFAGGPCSTNNCADIDFNNDNLFPDDADLVGFISLVGGGTCP